ncbi:hypothetical protein [Brevibacterium aurantiacum]|uniref:hypothetical protein n=1 Tax=Brevibacterium aurantiacum TaxID=273384 RepID=UPI000F6400C0|nr:hypothetical protein [Brevibacterium aurantiacum]
MNTQTFVWMPVLVLGGVWLITLLIYWIISASGVEGPMYSGGSQAPLWYFAVVGAQAMNRTFYFSQAMSLTRREFYLGSLVAAGISAVGISVVFMFLGLVEQATDGYGINGYFAYLPWVWVGGPLAAGLTYFVLTMLTFILGFWFAIVLSASAYSSSRLLCSSSPSPCWRCRTHQPQYGMATGLDVVR